VTPLWNFAKYLVGRDGRPRALVSSLAAPASPVLTSTIGQVLGEPVPKGDR
jgi:glutathione peroxidase-family protein